MTGDKDFDELLNKCMDIMTTKSVDYAEEGDRLAEFRATSNEMNISMRQTLGVYMNKHFRSIKKWVRGDELKGEPVEEKFMDTIVYCLLGYKMSKEEMEAAPQSPAARKEGYVCTAEGKQVKYSLCGHNLGYGNACVKDSGHRGPCK